MFFFCELNLHLVTRAICKQTVEIICYAKKITPILNMIALLKPSKWKKNKPNKKKTLKPNQKKKKSACTLILQGLAHHILNLS